MKFAHMADLHIGGWRDPRLQDLPLEAFRRACRQCIERQVDFIVIAGDIFNTSLPSIDSLKGTVQLLRELKKASIPVYIVPGSHDYSPSGKTMLDVIEETGLWTNVVKGKEVDGKLQLTFTVDAKTGAKLTGLLGKRATLEKNLYSALDLPALENEKGFKIFLFHSGIDELKPSQFQHVESLPLSYFPKGFDYYAGGHIHIIETRQVEGYGTFAYPGPLFPNSFPELEDLGGGGFYLVEDGSVERIPITLHPVVKCKVALGGCTPEEAQKKLEEAAGTLDVEDALVCMRLHGKLISGKVSDLDLQKVTASLEERGAYLVMKNLSKLESNLFEELKVEQGTVDQVEDRLIKEHAGQAKFRSYSPDEERALIKNLMQAFEAEKGEGETNATFEERLGSELKELLENDT